MATIQDFKNAASEFMALFHKLGSYDVRSYPAQVQGEYLDLMKRGDWIKNAVQAFTKSVDFAAGAYDSILDFFGLSAQEDGLSAVPVAVAVGGAAGVGAAVLLITKWIKDARIMQIRLEIAEDLISQGVPPERAYELALQMTETGGAGIIGGAVEALWPVLIFGGAVYLFANSARR